MPDVNKAVKSAEGVALLRAAATHARDARVRNPDRLARYFVNVLYRILLLLPHPFLRWLTERLVPGGYCYFLARTRYFDQVFAAALADDYEQFVLLGAGYDTRAHRFRDQLRGRTVFEVDLPGAQQRKRRILERVGLADHPGIVYVANDFDQRSVDSALGDAGFDFGKKTLFLLEGVSYYIDESSLRKLLALCAGCGAGSQMVFDYSIRSFLEGDFSTYGSRRMARWLKRNNEPFRFGIAPEELPDFVSSCRLRLLENLQRQEIIRNHLIDSADRQVGEPLGYLCFALCVVD